MRTLISENKQVYSSSHKMTQIFHDYQNLLKKQRSEDSVKTHKNKMPTTLLSF